MGKLTLLFVVAAIGAGYLLTHSTANTTQETLRTRVDGHADVISRDLATAAHGLVVSGAVRDDGTFDATAPFTTRSYNGGELRVVDYDALAGGDTLVFTVEGRFGGATHRIRSRYGWDPMDFPGAMWFDVPYLTARLDPDAAIDNRDEDGDRLPVYFDQRKYDRLRLSSLVPIGDMRSRLNAELAGSSSQAGALATTNMEGLLEDLNMTDAADLYYAAASLTPTADDRVLAGPFVAQDLGGTQRVVRVTDGLTVQNGETMSGTGILIVEGPLRVEPGGELEWSGLVIVHEEEPFLDIRLDGEVDLRGGLVVDHQAVPPGGHMDVTVFRSLSGGWAQRWGDSGLWGGAYPWYEHTHEFDLTTGTPADPNRTVVFMQNGMAGPHGDQMQFAQTLGHASIVDEQVYLEFVYPESHGYSTYQLDIAGEPQVYQGAVKNGFGVFSQSGSVHRSQSFRAGDLETLVLDVRSLRMLRARFDGQDGCEQWPFCVGRESDRGRSLTVRVRRASNDARLYEAAVYWHMRADEVADHEASEAAWRTLIESGAAFGTRLDAGADVRITYDLDRIMNAATRLGFDGDEVVHGGSWTHHVSPQQARNGGS